MVSTARTGTWTLRLGLVLICGLLLVSSCDLIDWSPIPNDGDYTPVPYDAGGLPEDYEWGYPDHRYYFPPEYVDRDYLGGGETAIVVESRNNVPAIYYGEEVTFANLSDKAWLVNYNKLNDPIYRSLDGSEATSTVYPSSNFRESSNNYGIRADSFLTFYFPDGEISNPNIQITGEFTDGRIQISNDGNSFATIWDSATEGTFFDLEETFAFGISAIRFVYGESTWNDESHYLELNELQVRENGTDPALTLVKINPISVFYEFSDFRGLGTLTSSEIHPDDLLMENILDWAQDDDIMDPFDDNPGILGLYTGVSLMEALEMANYKGQILKWLDYVDKMLGTYNMDGTPWESPPGGNGGTGPEYFNYVKKSQLSGLFVNCSPDEYQGGSSGKGGLWADWDDDTIWMSMDQKMAVARPLAGQADLWDIGAHELLHSYEPGFIIRLGLNTDDGQPTVNGPNLDFDFHDHGYVYTTSYGEHFLFREEFSRPGLETISDGQSRFWAKAQRANLRFFNTVFYGDVFTDRDGFIFHPDPTRDGVDFELGDEYEDENELFVALYDNYYSKFVDYDDYDMDDIDRDFAEPLMRDEEFEFYYQTENDPVQFHRSVNQMLFRAWLAEFREDNNGGGYSEGVFVDMDRRKHLALYLSVLRNDLNPDYTINEARYLVGKTEADLEAELNALYDLYQGFVTYFELQ